LNEDTLTSAMLYNKSFNCREKEANSKRFLLFLWVSGKLQIRLTIEQD